MSALLARLRPGRRPTPYRSALATAEQEMRSREWNNAAAAYQRALDLSPKSVHLLVQIGHCKKELGDFGSAAIHYAKYLESCPDDLSVRDHLSFVSGRQHAASHVKDLAFDKMTVPSDAVEKRQNALALLAAKRWQPAAEMLHSLCSDESADNDDLWCLLGHARKESADFIGAREAYQCYLKYANSRAPGRIADAYMQLGHLHKIEGDYRSAFDFYIKANAHIGKSSDLNPREVTEELQGLANLLFPTFWPIKSD